jgi:ribosome-binding factor A
MSRPKKTRRPPSPHQVPRTARLNELIREIVAEELERIDDERLEHVAITAVDVDSDLNRAIVFFDSWRGPEGDPPVLAAFAERRVRLQGAIAAQMRARKTPILEFRPDEVIRSAERIEQILRDLPPVEDEPDSALVEGDDRPA